MLIGRYSALLDACTLHPAFLRAALLWFADARLLRPTWSHDILSEWRRSVRRRYPDISDETLNAIQEPLTSHFPDGEITGYEPFVEALDLPDPNDRHVLAAAIVGRCNGIITANIKDFPADKVSNFGIEVVHPDQFIVNIIDLDEKKALAACKRHREAMAKTKPSPEDYLERYARCGLIQAHQRLLPHIELI